MGAKIFSVCHQQHRLPPEILCGIQRAPDRYLLDVEWIQLGMHSAFKRLWEIQGSLSQQKIGLNSGTMKPDRVGASLLYQGSRHFQK